MFSHVTADYIYSGVGKEQGGDGDGEPGWSRGNFHVVPDKRHSFHAETRVVLTVNLPRWVRFDMVSSRKALIQASARTFLFRHQKDFIP